jgi:hypothetical protein
MYLKSNGFNLGGKSTAKSFTPQGNSAGRSMYPGETESFMQAQFDDLNIWTEKKRIEKNPSASGVIESFSLVAHCLPGGGKWGAPCLAVFARHGNSD